LPVTRCSATIAIANPLTYESVTVAQSGGSLPWRPKTNEKAAKDALKADPSNSGFGHACARQYRTSYGAL